MISCKQTVTTRKSQWKTSAVRLAQTETKPNLVLTGETDQTWLGWGGCFNELGGEALSVLPRGKQERLLGDLFDPAGACRFNFCRLPIGANDYSLNWYSLNEHADDFKMRHFSISCTTTSSTAPAPISTGT
jgi:glucosylceramidase